MLLKVFEYTRKLLEENIDADGNAFKIEAIINIYNQKVYKELDNKLENKESQHKYIIIKFTKKV